MSNLVKTGVGLITSENANWLYKQGVITREGFIKHNLVEGISGKKVQLYSYFRWIIDDIKEKIPTAPKQANIEIDDLIDIMRTGEINKPYKVGDDEYHYMAKYPKVENIYLPAKKIIIEHQPTSKGRDIKFIDFDEDLI